MKDQLQPPLEGEMLNRIAYDQIAQVYSHFNYDSDIRDSLQLISPITTDSRILDLGCGPGNNIRLFSEYNPQQIVGVDISPEMLAVAERNIGQTNNIHLIENSFADFETEDKFDLIVANLSFVHVPPDELVEILKKIEDWLARDGVFFANYFEGVDEVKTTTSKWGIKKRDRVSIDRMFAFHSEDFLREAYEEAELNIFDLSMIKPSPKALTRINISATKSNK